MSDLSRLRRRLLRVEQTGKRIKRELDEAKAARADAAGVLTRTEERRFLRLEQDLKQARDDWARLWDALRKEERRLLNEPGSFLRFS